MSKPIDVAGINSAIHDDYFFSESKEMYTSLRESGYALLDNSSLPGFLTDAKLMFTGTDKIVFNSSDNISGFFPAKDKAPEHFILSLSYLNSVRTIAETNNECFAILDSLGYSISPNHQSQFSDLLDRKIMHVNAPRSTIVKTFNYKGGDNQLEDHDDRGLITIVISDAEGLEVWDSRDEEWMNIPANMPVLLVGHTLEVPSAGAFKATKHRVKDASARISVAFQVRGRGDAKIMYEGRVPKGIRSKGLIVEDGLTVGEIMKRFADSHRSVTNHGNCALSSSSASSTATSSVEKRRRDESSGSENNSNSKRITPTPESDNDSITIRIKFIKTGEKTFFRIKRSTRLDEVFQNYAARKGVDQSTLAFLNDGYRIYRDQTPRILQLGDQDQIDCVTQQCGD